MQARSRLINDIDKGLLELSREPPSRLKSYQGEYVAGVLDSDQKESLHPCS